jgi:hypothetical protein
MAKGGIMFPIFRCLIIALVIVIERTIEAGLSEKDFLRWKLEEMLALVGQGSRILFLKLKVRRSHSEHGILAVV